MTEDSATNDPIYLYNIRAYKAMMEMDQTDLEKLAKEGEPYALVAFGARLANEDGEVKPDYEEAARHYLEAAEKGLALAQILIGEYYRDGKGVKEDQAEAKKWFQKAAVQGAPPAMHQLALYHHESGAFPHALELLLTAAEKGFAPSQSQLGNLYAYDKNIGIDYDEAFKWTSRAASTLPHAKLELAKMLGSGRGCDADQAAALLLFEELASEGDREAAFLCGAMHWMGEGTAIDIERGAKLIEWAAEEGLTEASSWLAKLNHMREPAFAFREQHDIDDWLYQADPSPLLLEAAVKMGCYLDETGLAGRAEEISKHGIFAFDSRLAHYRCPKCNDEFAEQAIRHLPRVFYRNWDELITYLHLLMHVQFEDDQENCPKCGDQSNLAFIDLHLYNSQLQKDLVMRTVLPDRMNVALSYKTMSWSSEDGYARVNMDDLNGDTLAVDAMVRRIGVMLEGEGLEHVQQDVIDMIDDPDIAAYMPDAISVMISEDPRLLGLGEYASKELLEHYPEWTEAYAALAECYLHAYQSGHADPELKEDIDKLLLMALTLDPENEKARELQSDLRELE